jgi:serine-aspartate repeat-containing protein C/D/E
MPKIADAIVRAREPTVLDLTLLRPATISGLIWDPDAEAALEGVEVSLLSPDGSKIGATFTDAEGQYRFGGLRSGSYQVVPSSPHGYVSLDAAKTVTVRPNEAVEVDFEYRPGGVVKGRVLDEHTGEPLADVQVVLLDAEGRALRRARTTAGGEYEFVNLPEDRYRVAIGDDTSAA